LTPTEGSKVNREVEIMHQLEFASDQQ
jgi:hypothetical protein